MDCKSNLSKCGAACCKCVAIVIFNPGVKHLDWLKSKGCTITPEPKDQFLVVIPRRCSALTEENLCSLHGTDKKPAICKRLDEGHTKGCLVPKNCLLEVKP